MVARANCVIALRSEDVSLVLDISNGQLPAIVHGGADLGKLELDEVEALILAREILDFAGHWGKERVAQRRPLTAGVHLREGCKGRTGADAATLLHVGVPGFSFAEGEIWAVHTAWSGNHTHYAERLFTGTQVIGGGTGPSGGVCLLTAATVSYYPGQCWAPPASWLPTCIPIMRSFTARRRSTDSGRWPYWGQAAGAG
jgi:hypothetical protein